MELEDLENLIDLRIAHEKWSLLDELSKDASDGPHVDAKRVFSFSKKNFWSSIPESFDLMCKSLDWDGKCPCETEIANLDVALVIDKEILGLKVPMDHSFGVAVVDTTEKLVNHFLNLLLVHRSFVFSHILF